MSLVGSLEDLGLGDILQIVSLSRKSGLLLLRSEEGDGRILFCDGLIRAAFVKGEAEDLRALLVSADFIDAEAFDRAAAKAAAHGDPIEEVLSETEGFSKERLDSRRREQVERSVFRMFAWKVGEFSFEIRDEVDDRDRELMLATGINAQYLTMEATRLGDEFEKDGDDDIHFGTVDDPGDEEIVLDELAGADPSIEDPVTEGSATEEIVLDELAGADPSIEESVSEGSATEEIADCDGAAGEAAEERSVEDFGEVGAELSHEVAEPGESDDTEPEIRIDADSLAAAEHIALAAVERLEATEIPTAMAAPTSSQAESDTTPPPAEPESSVVRSALVIIDPDLAALEWQKSVLGPVWQRIHIFQRAENGIARIRQYLRRGEEPHVLVSSDVPSDPLSGFDGPMDLLRRLRAHAPRMRIHLVQSGVSESVVAEDPPCETLRRPANHELANRRSWERLESAGAALREELGRSPDARPAAPPISEPVTTEPSAERFSEEGLRRLKSMSDRLRDPSVRGEVLSLILEFAAESFSRVAIFMVRDDDAVGMAQAGLERAGGPGDAEFREIVLPVRDPSWFRNVLDRREGLRAPPGDAGDHELAALLGGRVPHQAYVAPIESSHRVVALVYVDNLPEDTPIGETASLEIFLHEAGLALERALLERALADASERGSA